MAKRILILSLAYYPRFIGGDGVAIREITNRIAPSDIVFDMITLRFDSTLPKVEKIDNVTVHRIGFSKPNPTFAELKAFPLYYTKPLFQFMAAWKALSLHRKYKYDALWAMMAHSTGVPAALFKFFHPHVPYVLTLQEGDPPEYIEHKMRPLWPLFSRAFTKADRIQVISNFLGEWAKRMGFKGSVSVIPNGFNTNAAAKTYSDQEISDLKKTLDKKEDDLFLITVSRLVHKNAVDDAIRSLSFLPEHVKLIVVGGGPDELALKELADSLGVSPRVRFVGQVATSETGKYRRVSDIFVRPSRSEGLGNSFISTMVAGLPVIATQEGGIADFLFDAKRNPTKPTTGWAVDKDAPQQIAAAVMEIIAHPEVATQVVATAHAFVLEHYNWDTIAKDMEQLFMEAIQKNY